jgi:hypothetical protein
LRNNFKAKCQQAVVTSADELENYLNEPNQDEDDDPVMFWARRSKQFPRLSKVALEFLTPPASSVSSERIVSSLNFVLSKHRTRLLSSNVEKLVMLRDLPLSIWTKVLKSQ